MENVHLLTLQAVKIIDRLFYAMTYLEIKNICQRGKIGLIPGWIGYIKYNYGIRELEFVNGDYKMSEKELESKIKDRNDLYYII